MLQLFLKKIEKYILFLKIKNKKQKIIKNTSYSVIIILYNPQKKFCYIKKMWNKIEKYCNNYSNFEKIGVGVNGIVYLAIHKIKNTYILLLKI